MSNSSKKQRYEEILHALISTGLKGKSEKAMDYKRTDFIVKVYFDRRMYVTTIHKACKLLSYKRLKKPTKVVIVECDENYVGHHALKNYVNVGGNILELISSQFYNDLKGQLYHKLKKVSKNKGKFKVIIDKRLNKDSVDVYTLNPEDIEIGLIMCVMDKLPINFDFPLDDNIRFPKPVDFEFYSEQSSVTNVDNRLKILSTMNEKIISVVSKNRSATSNFDSNNEPGNIRVDISFEKILDNHISNVADLKQAFVTLFENFRLGFVKTSDLNNKVTNPQFVIGNEFYQLVCYDYKKQSYVITGYETDTYCFKFMRFINGNHIGQTEELHGTDRMTPDFIFTDCIYNEAKRNVFEYNQDYLEVRIDSGTSEASENGSTDDDGTSIYDVFSNMPQRDKNKLINKLQKFEQDSGKDMSKFKNAITKTPERALIKSTSKRHVFLIEIKNSEVITAKFKFKFEIGYNRLICKPSDCGVDDYVCQQRGFIQGLNLVPDGFGNIALLDVLKYYRNFAPSLIDQIIEKINEEFGKDVFLNALLNCRESTLKDYSWINFDKLIEDQLLFNLEPNPNYLVKLISREKQINFEEIVNELKNGRLKKIIKKLESLTNVLNTELDKPLNVSNKVQFKNQSEKVEIINEAIKTYKQQFDYFNKEAFSNELYNTFMSRVDLPYMYHDSSCIEDVLDEVYGLNRHSTEENWINVFGPSEKMVKRLKNKDKLRKKLLNIKNNFNVFKNYFEVEDRCISEDYQLRALSKTLDIVF